MVINGKTRLLGLLGDPVEHTLSPDIHNYISEILDINSVYVPFHTQADYLADAVKGAYGLNILGLNCTVPHKNAVIECLAEIDEGAAAIGSVNTLVRIDGGYKGYNTDMMGLYRELESYNIDLTGRPVIILGAGGAAKAVIYMCMKYGASVIYLLNRTKKRAETLAEYYSGIFDNKKKIIPMSLDEYKNIPEDKYIVFQATSIGLAPDNDNVVIEDKSFYKLVDVGIDLIYNPFETRFMKLCKSAGATCYNGLKMLLYQGIIAYELWNNISVSKEVADKIYSRLLKRVRNNIVLIGFMGSGKTTIGHALSKKFGYKFIDTDSIIVEKYGNISDIFAEKGEEYFRELETKVICELNRTISGAVISTGGGLPLRSENAFILKELGKVVFLDITEDEVIRRLAGDITRPLLAGNNPQKKISEMISYRTPLYKAASDQIVSVSGRSVEEIVSDIVL